MFIYNKRQTKWNIIVVCHQFAQFCNGRRLNRHFCSKSVALAADMNKSMYWQCFDLLKYTVIVILPVAALSLVIVFGLDFAHDSQTLVRATCLFTGWSVINMYDSDGDVDAYEPEYHFDVFGQSPWSNHSFACQGTLQGNVTFNAPLFEFKYIKGLNYSCFSTVPSACCLVDKYPKLIVLQTLSKVSLRAAYHVNIV